MFKNWQNHVLSLGAVALFLVFAIWWAYLFVFNIRIPDERVLMWGSLYGLVGLYGGLLGIFISRKWGGIHSVLGKSILFFALGLFFQEIGQLAYSYYIIILKIDVPYPSIGDFFFYGSIPLYITAVIYLARAAGVHISLRSFKNKVQAVLIPTGMLLIAYFLFLQGYEFDWSQPLTIAIDFGAPLLQAIYISLALLTYILTRGILGGVMRIRVLLVLFALFAQFSADWIFLYQASQGTWYGGGINDFSFLLAYFIMAMALIQFGNVYKKLSSS